MRKEEHLRIFHELIFELNLMLKQKQIFKMFISVEFHLNKQTNEGRHYEWKEKSSPESVLLL